MMPNEIRFNNDQIIVSENEQPVEINSIDRSSNAMNGNNNKEGIEEKERDSLHSSSPSLGNHIDITSPLLLQISEEMNESSVDNIQHVHTSNSTLSPSSIAISADTNHLFPSLEEQNFDPVDHVDGLNFAYQNQLLFPPDSSLADYSFPLEASEIMNNQDNGFGYIPFELPTKNWSPEFQPDSSVRLQAPPFNLHNSQIGVGNQNDGSSNFMDSATQWTNMHDNIAFGSQEIQFQQEFGSGFHGQGSIYSGGSSSNQFKFSNIPDNLVQAIMNIQNGMPPPENLHQPGWIYQEDNIQNPGYPNNSIYDRFYESMNLPIDPHLRMFLPQRDHGAGL